jgi:hypothetical protein
MNLKSILIVGLSMTTLGLALPAHAGYSYVGWFFGDLRVDSLTDRPGDRASTNTSPTNVQNAEATNISNSTNESIQTKVEGIYGTERKPQPCPSSRVAPQRGALSIEQAKVYFHCDNEKEFAPTRFGQGMLWLVSDLDIKIAPRPRAITSNDLEYASTNRGNLSIDTQQPVYDIKASFIITVCHSLGRFNLGERCSAEYHQNNSGICFRDTFSDWHCRSLGSAKPTTPVISFQNNR